MSGNTAAESGNGVAEFIERVVVAGEGRRKGNKKGVRIVNEARKLLSIVKEDCAARYAMCVVRIDHEICMNRTQRQLYTSLLHCLQHAFTYYIRTAADC
jgi:hypothetical protein